MKWLGVGALIEINVKVYVTVHLEVVLWRAFVFMFHPYGRLAESSQSIFLGFSYA